MSCFMPFLKAGASIKAQSQSKRGDALLLKIAPLLHPKTSHIPVDFKYRVHVLKRNPSLD